MNTGTIGATSYMVVIATRNRPDALALSLPLHLAQSRKPTSILVIDSSDDPSANTALVTRLSAETDIPLAHQTSPSGLTVQRNIGLPQIDADVVFFPDDDSLVHPGALDAIMRIYDLDADGRIGGVGAREAGTSPLGGTPDGAPAYRMRASDRFKARISKTRYAVEKRLFTDPFSIVGARKIARLAPAPDWLDAENAVVVPWLTGFRMSFRAEVIRKVGFNENLGRYSLFEDIDAGFGVLETHLLVGARNASIYHHKAPSNRANGRALGAMHLLNRAYVVARAGEADARMRRAIAAHARYKIAQYAANPTDAFGRARIAGALAARRRTPALYDAAPEDLDRVYLKIRDSIFRSES